LRRLDLDTESLDLSRKVSHIGNAPKKRVRAGHKYHAEDFLAVVQLAFTMILLRH